jgi:predicted amidohydrolase
MTDTLPIAVAQFAPTADTTTNLESIEQLVTTASVRGARVVVLPEYASYFVDPFDESLAANAQDLDGAFVQALTRIARAHEMVIVAGLLERATDGERVRNTAVAVDAGGLLAHYRKLHLYDAFGQRESDWVEPGEPAEP